MRSHAAKSWCRVVLCGKANIFLQQVGHTVPGEWRALMALEKEVVAAFATNDATQGRRGLWPERTDALFPPLTQKPHLPRTIQTEVAGAHRQRFADPGARIVEEQEQRMVTTATWRTGVDCSNHGPGLIRLEVCDCSVSRPFGTNRQYAPVLAGARDVVLQKVLYEATDGRQPTVPRHGGVAALRFDVVQEFQHGFGLNVIEIEICDCFAFVASQEQEEQLQRVAVGPYGVAASSPSGAQIVEEEALGQGEERIWLGAA